MKVHICYLFVLNSLYSFAGYDAIPIESLQGLDIGSHHGAGGSGSTYGPMDDAMDVGQNSADLDFDHLDELPQPPQDNNQVAAWYDTDL